MICAMLPVTALAAEGNVARIKETGVEYVTLDEAVTAAQDGQTIELLGDATTSGLELRKDLSIEGASDVAEKPTITFTDKGIALWGKTLTFKDCKVNMIGIGSTPYTAEWGWMTISASVNAKLVLDNVVMTMDATGTSNSPHAIYFCSNNVLDVVNGSTLTIKNYKQDALEWDGGDGGYNVNIKDSKFISDHNRSGFTGTFYATIENSIVDVTDSSGNGSNGSHFIIKDSTVKFNDNGSHGLSAANLTIDNSVVEANRNGICGIIATGELDIKNESIVDIKKNKANCSMTSAWSRPGAMCLKGTGTISEDSKVTITDNEGCGIYLWNNSASLDMKSGIIQRNTATKAGKGGGIYNEGTCVVSDAVQIYNNHAPNAVDDIFNAEEAEITIAKTGKGWSLDGGEDCDGEKHLIDGWYDDVEGTRWEAHAENEEDNHIVEVEAGVLSIPHALKAAHGKDAQNKASEPGMEKVIINADGEEVKSTSAAKGDKVKFELQSNVPEELLDAVIDEAENPEVESLISLFSLVERGTYLLTIHDQMDEMLELLEDEENPIVVKIGDKTLTEDVDYTLIKKPANNHCTFEIEMDLVDLYDKGIITRKDIEDATEITVEYTARLSEDATAGTYSNIAWVTYNNEESEKSQVDVDTYGVKVFKYNQASPSVALRDAEFEIYSYDSLDAEGEPVNPELIAELSDRDMNDEERYVYDGLKAGDYYIIESKAPDGFVKSEAKLFFSIPKDEDIYNYVQVKFANSPIPHTGGTGTRMYTIAGAVIILGAGALLVVSRRKKEDK